MYFVLIYSELFYIYIIFTVLLLLAAASMGLGLGLMIYTIYTMFLDGPVLSTALLAQNFT